MNDIVSALNAFEIGEIIVICGVFWKMHSARVADLVETKTWRTEQMATLRRLLDDHVTVDRVLRALQDDVDVLKQQVARLDEQVSGLKGD